MLKKFLISLSVVGAVAFFGLMALAMTRADTVPVADPGSISLASSPRFAAASSTPSATVQVEGRTRRATTPASCYVTQLDEPCDLNDEICRSKVTRLANGGDVLSQYYLMRYFSGRQSAGLYGKQADVTRETYIYSAMVSCSLDPAEQHKTKKYWDWCPIGLKPAVGRGMGTQRACDELDIIRFCDDRTRTIFTDASKVNSNLRSAMSTSEREAAQDALRDRLSALGAEGLIAAGRLHQSGCGLPQDRAMACAFFRAAANEGSSRGQKEWDQIRQTLSYEEQQRCIRQMANVNPRTQLELERRKFAALQRVDEIEVRELQVALRDLGHYDGAADNTNGPLTQEAFNSFAYCEGMPIQGRGYDQLAVRIVERAALQGKDPATGMRRHCHAYARPSPASMHLLGMMYMLGIGKVQDLDAANDWFAKAVSAGHAPSKLGMAVLYSEYKLERADTNAKHQDYLTKACGYFNDARAHGLTGRGAVAHMPYDVQDRLMRKLSGQC